MRSTAKLKTVPVSGDLPRDGSYLEGFVVAVAAQNKATVRDATGTCFDARIPRSIDKRWLAAAVGLAPVPALVLRLESSQAAVLAHVFAAPEHEVLDEHVRIDAKTIELAASESVHIRTGRSIVTVTADGEIRVRGKNISSRASNLHRIRGGAVRIN